jgi:hypothetical protein
MAFFDTLGALLIALTIAWGFKKFIEPRLDHVHDNLFKRFGGKNMNKLCIDIEHSSNGGYVVTWYKVIVAGLLQKMAGVKPEKEQLAFEDKEKLCDWIIKNC